MSFSSDEPKGHDNLHGLVPNCLFHCPVLFGFTWSFSHLHIFAGCLFLLGLTLSRLLCPANFFHCPSQLLIYSYSCESLPVHVSFYAERPVPLKIPLWLLCFTRTRIIKAEDKIKWKIKIILSSKIQPFSTLPCYWMLWYSSSLQLCHLNTEWH